MPCVCTYIEDNTEAAYQAVQHLYTHGCRKMGFIGDPDVFHGIRGTV